MKGGTVWYEGHGALSPGKDPEESDERARKEASIYRALGQHDSILSYLGLEVSTAIMSDADTGTEPTTTTAWAIRLERAPHGCLRDRIAEGTSADDAPHVQTRLDLAVQFTEGGCAHARLRYRLR